MKTLRDVRIGQTVKVVKLHGEGPVKRRIMDMGIIHSHQCIRPSCIHRACCLRCHLFPEKKMKRNHSLQEEGRG